MAKGIEIRIESNVPAARAWFRHLAKKQLPFATARGLTEIAKLDAAPAVRKDLPSRFTTRRDLGPAITIVPASKRAWPKPVAYVATKSWAAFLTPHWKGGTKRGKKGHRIAVPTRIVRRTSGGKIPKPKTPRRVLALKSSFTRGGRIEKKRTKRKPLGIFYHLTAEARIRKAWPIDRVVADAVRRRGPRRLRSSLIRAVRARR